MASNYRFNKLLFFNKEGKPLDFKYDPIKRIWTGSLFLKKISIGLFEVERIYILEEIIFNNNYYYSLPLKEEFATNNYWNISLRDKKEFRFFSVDNHLEESPLISIINDQSIKPGTNDVLHFDNGFGYQEVFSISDIKNKPLRFDILIKSDVGGNYSDLLTISDDLGLIAEIKLYGEIEEEDERLPQLLANIGEVIRDNEEFIFRESDIKEDLPNYQLLNSKRKEFLLEAHNIKPYLSAYKGFYNILNFFGYSDLRVKEYWLNTETKKLILEDPGSYEVAQLKSSEEQKKKYKKTSYFGLFYDIRVDTGDFDDEDLPIYKDNFAFSQEEVIIKLFSLKNYIKRRNIGGVSQIIDIIGEDYFFSKYRINNWRDDSTLIVIDESLSVKFEKESTGYIEDIRPYIEDFSNCQYDQSDDLIATCLWK
jgi:hypothetical protein